MIHIECPSRSLEARHPASLQIHSKARQVSRSPMSTIGIVTIPGPCASRGRIDCDPLQGS